MIARKYEVEVNRPVREVWDFLMDIRSDARWVAGVKEGWQTSKGPLGVGTTFRYRMRVIGMPARSDILVTGHEEPRWHEVKVSSGPVSFTASYSLEQTATGTRLTMDMQGGVRTLLKPFEPLMARMMHRQWQGNAQRLKALLDGGATPAQPVTAG